MTYLQTFLAVAEENSFTKAAESLDVSKGLVSRHIQRLEEALNAKLLHRTTRLISLTEVGEELYLKAQQIQLLATEAEIRIKDVTEQITGDLKITAPFEFGRALCRNVIPYFLKEYPDVNLILDFGPTKKRVETGDFDIAFRAYEELPNDAVGKELGFIRNVLVCSHEYPQLNQIKTIKDLHQHAFILNGQDERWNQLELIGSSSNYNIEVKGSLCSNTYSSILELVMQGLGIASLPYYQVEEEINKGNLIHILPEMAVKVHKISIVYAQRRVTPRKLVTFNLAVREWLKSNQLYLLD